MTEKLRLFIDQLFADAPKTKGAEELKEEIFQNLQDKYNDLISEGKTKEAAYNLSIASVGDVNSIIEELKKDAGARAMSDSTEKAKKRTALIVAVAVAFYILSPVPIIVLSIFGQVAIGIVLMFLLIAAATALLIYNGMTGKLYSSGEIDDKTENKKSKKEKDPVKNSIESTLWTIIVAVYFIFSFTTHRWDISWIIFLIGSALNGIIDSIFALLKK